MPTIPTLELPELPTRPPRAPGAENGFSPSQPLRGITILAVEDSRFASEALRLMCHRLGARLRRAESLQAARAHLRLYRPDIMIVDLGLPDGRGEALIRETLLATHAPIILGTSGDPQGRALALSAGARGFLEKPLESLAAFRDLLTHHLPDRPIPALSDGDRLSPDSLALRDDLAHAADMIDAGLSEAERSYLTGFLTGVASHAHDQDLVAALAEGDAPDQRLARIRPLLDRRLSGQSAAFSAGEGTSSE